MISSQNKQLRWLQCEAQKCWRILKILVNHEQNMHISMYKECWVFIAQGNPPNRHLKISLSAGECLSKMIIMKTNGKIRAANWYHVRKRVLYTISEHNLRQIWWQYVIFEWFTLWALFDEILWKTHKNSSYMRFFGVRWMVDYMRVYARKLYVFSTAIYHRTSYL